MARERQGGQRTRPSAQSGSGTGGSDASSTERNRQAAREHLEAAGYANVSRMTDSELNAALRKESYNATGWTDYFEQVTGVDAGNLSADDMDAITKANRARFDSSVVKQHENYEDFIKDLPPDVRDSITDPGRTVIPDELRDKAKFKDPTETPPSSGGSDAGTDDDPMNPDRGAPPASGDGRIPVDPRGAALAGGAGASPLARGGSQASGGTGGSHTSSGQGGGGGGAAGLGGDTGLPGHGIPQAGGGGTQGGGDASGSDAGSGSGGDAPGAPPDGSTKYSAATKDAAGNPMAAETGWRDENGNWYNDDGSPMDQEKADRMEKRHQEGSTTVVRTSGTSGSGGGDGGDGDSGGEGDGDAGADAGADDGEPTGDDEDKDVEYTPSGEGGGGDSPAGQFLRGMIAEHQRIRDEGNAGSLINPTREGGEDRSGGDPRAGEKSLVGPDGDTRLDGAAQSSGTGKTGPNWGSSTGAGAIDYGPDQLVDYGEGLTEDMPTEFGPTAPINLPGKAHDGDGEESGRSGLPAGISASDLKVGPDFSPAVNRGPVSAGLASEPAGMQALGPPVSSMPAEASEAQPATQAQATPVLDVFQAQQQGRASGGTAAGGRSSGGGPEEVLAGDEALRPDLRQHLQPASDEGGATRAASGERTTLDPLLGLGEQSRGDSDGILEPRDGGGFGGDRGDLGQGSLADPIGQFDAGKQSYLGLGGTSSDTGRLGREPLDDGPSVEDDDDFDE